MTASKYHQKFPHSQHTTALLTPSNTLKLSLQGGGGGNANIYPSLDAFRWADNASNLRKMWHNGILLHLYKSLAWHFQFHSNFVLCLDNASFVDSNESAKIIMLAMYCCSLSLHRLLSSCWTHERLSDCYELIHVSKIFLFFILFFFGCNKGYCYSNIPTCILKWQLCHCCWDLKRQLKILDWVFLG